MMRLQRCGDCGAAQYPARETCHVCLSDRLAREAAEWLPGSVLARTVLHHSNEPRFRSRLPLTLGLVRLDAGPVVVCFLAAAGERVRMRIGGDDLLEAT